MTTKGLHVLRPMLVEQIRRELATHFPTLHVFIEKRSVVEIRGAFPVIGVDGSVIDRFQVLITLPPNYPNALPVVKEVHGRIPWRMDRHVELDGTACVLLPEERWRLFPVGASFIEYLKGPLHSYFLSQLTVEGGGRWPFGEWGHGAAGILEYYRELLGLRTFATILDYLEVLKRPTLTLVRKCPCGSGYSIAECCHSHIQDLRLKIDPDTADRSLARIYRELNAYVSHIEPLKVSGLSAANILRAVGRARGL